jgi:1-deoxy-D-xylulose-5-phosphate reductoisomerase
MTRTVAVLGSTGSIGTNALDVISSNSGDLRVWGLSANVNWRALAAQARAFQPEYLSISDPGHCARLRETLPEMASKILPEGEFLELAAREADIVVVSVVGAAGLKGALAAARAGKRLALANKESLVMAGGMVMTAARQSGAQVIPIDSEHSALSQAFKAGRMSEVRRAVITASGGPFLDRPKKDFDLITVKEALAHPTWAMGKKITIDSATMANKAFEVIEAGWLFDLPPERISVVVHPESIVHSLVEFVDSSVIAQMAMPDMRLPIQYALLYPERRPTAVASLDFAALKALTFREPDLDKFPCLGIGFEVAREGGTTGAVFNAANEVAVSAFLDGRLSFSGIHRVIRAVLDRHKKAEAASLDAVFAADAWARMEAANCLHSTSLK